MKTIVMLPTYNERDNLRDVVEGILTHGEDIGVVVVDDHSPDGTGEVADELAAADPRVRVIHRQGRRGRGLAGAEGFCLALDEHADYIIEMDADRSHDPRFIPDFLRAITDCDMVIGSRFAEGGRDIGRGIARRLISRFANWYIRTILGVAGLTDCTSGYRCFTREAMTRIHPASLGSPGPSIVVEVLYRCRGMKIKEIPITFEDRRYGRSKFGLRTILQSLWFPIRLRLQKG